MQISSRDIYAAAALVSLIPNMEEMLRRGMSEPQAIAVTAKKASDIATAMIQAMGE